MRFPDPWSILLVAVVAAWTSSAYGGTLRGPFGRSDAMRHEARAHAFDLRHITVDIDLTGEPGTIAGTARLALGIVEPAVESVVLDAVEMEIAEARLARGVALEHVCDGGRLKIELDRAYEVGESLEVVIEYTAQPRRGLYFITPDRDDPARPMQVWSQGEPEETRYWIPIYDFPDDKATSELFVTVPGAMTTISNGELVATRPGPGDSTVFHWKQTIPHSTYLISLVAGSFDRYTETRSGVPLEYYVPPGTPKATVSRSFAATPDMLDFFERTIGQSYPWARYSQVAVQDFIFGGMENTSATTLSADTLHPASSEPNFASESLVAHELAHQ
ncbi:MAG: M1 family aminopeptidase, partial [Acidobacteriota bacterium]|nr:M1 family aminopeptidase [Acidobacteriota bacterium]